MRPITTPDPAFWSGKKVLVTGHTGFKGSWLTLWLQRLGAEVAGLALDPSTEPAMYDLVGNADLPGFTRNAQERLAALVGAHRGSFDPAAFEDQRPELASGLVGAALLLRVARILHRRTSGSGL